MHIVTGTEISDAIYSCAPRQIAVAYLGEDWQKYVPLPTQLDTIIISPTFGTNPHAVLKLAKVISWEKIYFLTELHAKVYLGDDAVVVGSANLTENGLDGRKLIECCFKTSERSALSDLNTLMEDWKSRARAQFPTTRDKKKRLAKLLDQWNTAIGNNLVPPPTVPEPLFDDFELLSNDQFYVAWYGYRECEYTGDLKQIQSDIADDMHFLPEDPLCRNKFVLAWKITSRDLVNKKVSPSWLYIHDIFHDSVVSDDYEYTTCVIQRKSLSVPPPPFKLTDEIVDAFREIIESGDLSKYLIQEGSKDTFHLELTFPGVPLLIDALKKKLEFRVSKKTVQLKLEAGQTLC